MSGAVQHRYAPNYCEENVWHLCGEPRFAGVEARVVFVSNAARACALWCQRAAERPGEAVVWDYHVILVARSACGWEVWDLDSTLGAPVALGDYLAMTFVDLSRLPPPLLGELAGLAPRFRVLEAERYRAEFSSDRSHMEGAGYEIRPPAPPWPAIVRRGVPSFLRWATMGAEPEHDVVGLDGLEAALERPPDR